MTSKLKLARKEAGLIRKELASFSGIPYRTIEHWETVGTAGARASQLLKVSKVLRVPMEELVDEE